MLIGIMGKTGSGKSTITRLINKDDKYLVIDVDKVNHLLIESASLKDDIVNRYPEVLEDGVINRKKLGMILYQDKEKMSEYNSLVWSYLEQELDKLIHSSTKPVIIDWMMLPLTKYYQMCDLKILIDSSLEKRLERVKKRDNIDEEHFIARDKNSVNYTEGDFDFIINNDKGFDEHEIKSIRKCISLYKR